MTGSTRLALLVAGSVMLIAFGAVVYFWLVPPVRLELWTSAPRGITGFFLVGLLISSLWWCLSALAPKFLHPAWAYFIVAAFALYVLNLMAIAAVFLLMLSAGALGFWVTRLLFGSAIEGIRNSRVPIALTLLLIATGLSLLSVLFLATSFTGYVTSGLYTLILVGLCAIGLRSGVYGFVADAFSRWRENAPPRLGLSERSCLAACVLPMVILVAFVSLPVTGADAVAAYLAFFEYIAQNGRWHHDPGFAAWALQPIGGLYQALAVMLIGGEGSASVLNLSWFLASLGCVGLIAIHISGSRLAGLSAAALYASLPMAMNITGHFYYDNAVAFYVTASVLALVLATSDEKHRNIYFFFACAALAGACGTKFTMWVAAPILFLYPLGLAARNFAHLRLLILSMAGFLLVTVVPMTLYSWWMTGNPVFPYYNQIFGSVYYATEQHGNKHMGYLGIDALYKMVFATELFSPIENRGAAGLVALIFPVTLLFGAFNVNARRWTVLFALIFLAFAVIMALQNDLRLLWPLFAVLIAIMVGVLFLIVEQGRAVARRTLIASLAMIIIAQFVLMPSGSWAMMRFPVQAALVPSARSAFIDQNAPQMAINAFLDAQQITAPRRLYLATQQGRNSATVFQDTWYNHIWRQKFRSLETQKEFDNYLQQIGLDAIIIGTHTRREKVPEAFYAAVASYARHTITNHQIFLAPMRVAYPLPMKSYKPTQTILADSLTERGYPAETRIDLRFRTGDVAADRFRLTLEYMCEIDRNFEPVVSYRSPKKSLAEARQTLPCFGEAKRGLAVLDIALPPMAPPDAQIFVGLWSTGRNSPITAYNIQAGMKPSLPQRPELLDNRP